MKKFLLLGMLLLISILMMGCGEAVTPSDDDPSTPNTQDPSNDDDNNDPILDDDPQEEEPNDEQTLPPDNDGTRVLVGSLESREEKEHTLTIEQAGVYEISSVALFDATGILYTTDGTNIRGDYRSGDFIITLYLEPNDYTLLVRGATRDEFGAYAVHVTYREDLAHVHYYVLDKVRLSSVNEHAFTITEPGTYQVIGESVINIQGTLYNALGSYLTTDYDSHTDGGFMIEYEFDVGTYEIHIRGYDWSAADYEILIIKTND